MTWQAVAAFLACARIGAIHSVVFAGFSSESLRDRINDCKSRVVITADEGRRGGKSIAIKALADKALEACPHVEHVLVLQHTGNPVNFVEGRDKWWHQETAKVPNYCPPALLSSEDGLFILYVSIWTASQDLRNTDSAGRLLDLLESPKVLCIPLVDSSSVLL
jgi:acetyl-CoA synthetase